MADISKITLPSGNTYDIKDAVARQQIAGGVSFNIVWTKSDYNSSMAPTIAKLGDIPDEDSEGNPIYVYYNQGANRAQGTLAASVSTVGQFYLIYSESQTAGDVFDEYATIQTGGGSGHSAVYDWEKIGDTQVDLTGLMTNITTTTDNVLGSDTTLNVTTTKLRASASGGNVAWNSQDSVTAITELGTPSTDTFLKTVEPKENTSTVAHSVPYVKSIGNQTKTKLSASPGTNDKVTVLTGLGSPSTDSVWKKTKLQNVDSGGLSYVESQGTIQTTKLSASVTPSEGSAASSVTPTTKKLVTGTGYGVTDQTTSVIGVTSATTTASKVTPSAPTNQTTATGSITVVNPSDPASTTDANSNNVYDPDECILVWPNVANETLVLRAGTLNTQTTSLPNYSISNVTVPIKADNPTTVPIKSSVFTYATGAVDPNGGGGTVVTDVAVGDTVTVMTGATVTLSSNASTGDVTVATGIGNATTKRMNVASDGTTNAVTGYASPTTDVVLGEATTVTIASDSTTGDVEVVTERGTVTNRYLSVGATTNGTADAITALGTPSTDSVIGADSTFTVTQPTIAITSGDSGVTVATGATINNNDTLTAVTSVTPVYAKESE